MTAPNDTNTIDREAVERAMMERVENGPFPFTFRDLWKLGDQFAGDEVSYRWADQLIQRERKAGRIVQAARGKWVRA